MFIGQVLCESQCSFRTRNDGEFKEGVRILNEPGNHSMAAFMIGDCLPGLGSDELRPLLNTTNNAFGG